MRAPSRRKTAEWLDGVTKNGNSTSGGKKPSAAKPNRGGKQSGGVTASRGGSRNSRGKMC